MKISSLLFFFLLKVMVCLAQPSTPVNPREHVGDTVTITGRIYAGYFLEHVRTKPTFLNVYDSSPNHQLMLRIDSGDRKNFPGSPEKYYLNKKISVTGVVKDYKGVPLIKISDSSMITAEDIDTTGQSHEIVTGRYMTGREFNFGQGVDTMRAVPASRNNIPNSPTKTIEKVSPVVVDTAAIIRDWLKKKEAQPQSQVPVTSNQPKTTIKPADTVISTIPTPPASKKIEYSIEVDTSTSNPNDPGKSLLDKRKVDTIATRKEKVDTVARKTIAPAPSHRDTVITTTLPPASKKIEYTIEVDTSTDNSWQPNMADYNGTKTDSTISRKERVDTLIRKSLETAPARRDTLKTVPPVRNQPKTDTVGKKPTVKLENVSPATPKVVPGNTSINANPVSKTVGKTETVSPVNNTVSANIQDKGNVKADTNVTKASALVTAPITATKNTVARIDTSLQRNTIGKSSIAVTTGKTNVKVDTVAVAAVTPPVKNQPTTVDTVKQLSVNRATETGISGNNIKVDTINKTLVTASSNNVQAKVAKDTASKNVAASGSVATNSSASNTVSKVDTASQNAPVTMKQNPTAPAASVNVTNVRADTFTINKPSSTSIPANTNTISSATSKAGVDVAKLKHVEPVTLVETSRSNNNNTVVTDTLVAGNVKATARVRNSPVALNPYTTKDTTISSRSYVTGNSNSGVGIVTDAGTNKETTIGNTSVTNARPDTATRVTTSLNTTANATKLNTPAKPEIKVDTSTAVAVNSRPVSNNSTIITKITSSTAETAVQKTSATAAKNENAMAGTRIVATDTSSVKATTPVVNNKDVDTAGSKRVPNEVIKEATVTSNIGSTSNALATNTFQPLVPDTVVTVTKTKMYTADDTISVSYLKSRSPYFEAKKEDSTETLSILTPLKPNSNNRGNNTASGVATAGASSTFGEDSIAHSRWINRVTSKTFVPRIKDIRIVQQEIPLYFNASTNATSISNLPVGEKIQVISISKDWTYITVLKTDSPVSGFIKNINLKNLRNQGE